MAVCYLFLQTLALAGRSWVLSGRRTDLWGRGGPKGGAEGRAEGGRRAEGAEGGPKGTDWPNYGAEGGPKGAEEIGRASCRERV